MKRPGSTPRRFPPRAVAAANAWLLGILAILAFCHDGTAAGAGPEWAVPGKAIARAAAPAFAASRRATDADGQRARACRVTAVVNHPAEWVALIAMHDETIETTGDHLFYVAGRGWTPAARLQPGSAILTSAAGVSAVVEHSDVRGVPPTQVYNLEVDRAHTYFVGTERLLVHNGLCVSRPAANANDPSVILGEHLSDATGSSAGGLFRGKDGVTRYVKNYQDPAHAYTEHLANQIYRDLGILAPVSVAFKDGRSVSYASRFVPEAMGAAHVGPLSRLHGREFMKGVLADELLNNADLHYGNVLITREDRVLRVDNGGALLFEGNKDDRKFEDEWRVRNEAAKTLRREMAQAAELTADEAAAVYKKALRDIRSLRARWPGGWKEYVNRVVPELNEIDKARIVTELNNATTALERHEILSPQQLRTGVSP